MSIQLIKKNQGIARKISDSYIVTNFITKENSKNVSFALSEATKYSKTTKNTKSDRIYYVLEGKLIVEQNKEKFVANSGDVVFIPKNTEYKFEGTFKAVLINSPAFNPKDEKISGI